VEFLCEISAAVHSRPRTPEWTVGVHEPWHRVLGTAEASRRAVWNHPLTPCAWRARL